MTVASFAGPFVMLLVVRGGPSEGWPPDRPVEWVTIALVLILTLALFVACVTLPWWYPPARAKMQPKYEHNTTESSDHSLNLPTC
jgi:hypothetical protein